VTARGDCATEAPDLAAGPGPARLPVAAPDLSGNEERYVLDAVRSSWISSTGAYLDRFEREFAQLCGTRHAIACANGTAALHLALAAAGIGPGDEVVVPALTYVATVNAVTYVGATPVFADVDPASWGLDPDSVAGVLSDRTRAVVAVHLYGQPADMDPLRHLCAPAGIVLVEDAAEAPMAHYRGRPTGGLGDIGTFSFFGNKILTCGEGGALTTDRDDLAATARLLRGQGMDPQRRYWFPVVGFNYRLTNVAAALLCAQLERREAFLAARRAIQERYAGRLAGVPGLSVQPELPDRRRSPWLACVLVDTERFGCDRDTVMRRLDEAGIETRPFFPPIHRLPPYRAAAAARGTRLPVTDRLAGQGVSLPTSVTMRPDDVDRVCDAILACRGAAG
jgi:perosamine synthetase